MRKLTFLLACLLLVSVGLVNAQSKTVSGTVFSADDGQPIIGATVMVKGTTVGTITNTDGVFKINLPGNAKNLVFSYVGMKTVELEAKNNMVVTLESDARQMDEVVVTAYGLKRSEKSLGFSASTVKNEELTAAKGSTVMGGLQGKVAGLTITNSGGTGSSQKVIIRGVTSFSGSNQPLYVINGVPIQNSFQGNNATNNSVDFGNLASDINPDDVESVTVLKGASATALYGSRAANGVIVITTKRGQSGGKLSVTYNGSVTASSVLRVPQVQQSFGEGWPFWDAAENGSWGPKLDGRIQVWGAYSNSEEGYAPKPATYSDYVVMKKPFSPIKDNLRNFYETGMEYNNSLSVSGSSENTSFMVTFSNVTADGVVPSNADSYKRNIISFRGDTKYKNFTASYDVNYVKKHITNVSSGQGSDGATMFQDIAQMPVDIPLASLKDYNSIYNNLDNFYTLYATNPYWIVANNGNEYKDDRIYGKVDLSLQLAKGLKWIGRIGGDYTNARQRNWNAVQTYSDKSWSQYSGKSAKPGTYQENDSYVGQLDATTYLSADYQLNQDFRFTGIAGVNYNEVGTYALNSYLYGLIIPNWYNLQNGSDKPLTSSSTSLRRLFGVLGQFDLSYKDWAFVTLSLRNDWSSTLPIKNNSYFYPGINTSFILTDAISALKDNNVLDFLKVRAAWGQTGNDAGVYLTKAIYSPTQIALGFGNLYTPIAGVSGLTEGNRASNNNLRPELTTEIEFGVEAKFLKNRLGFDATYYNKNTKDQIILATLAPETRFTSQARNIGLVNNQGVELRVWGVPVKTKDFSWDIALTFAKNKSEVKELWAGAKEYVIFSAYGVNFKAVTGQPLGIFTTPQAATTTDGKTIVASTGRPLIDAVNQKTVGTSSPDFTAGLTNRFTYKGVSLGFVLDMRQGGKFWSNTAELLAFDGNSTITTFNERQPFLVPNSVKNVGTTAAPVYVENDIPIGWQAMYSYYNHSTNTVMYEKMVLDKSYIKLREVTLSYTLPKSIFAKTPISSLELSLIGRNLLMWTPQANNFVDPESTNYGNDLLSDFGEFSAGPTMRNIGGSIKIIF